MEARLFRGVAIMAALMSLGASHRTANFIVTAPTTDMARQIGQSAEKYRRELAIEWLGEEMRGWSQPCPITAQVADNLGAGGATSFLFERGEVFGWRMTIQGSLVRILDSVLPHEVTHTIFATHFRRPLPRWADEGACTTVEHVSERSKQQTMLVDFLRTERGIPFSRLFAMKEYPHDVMPLYSQGYSLARYLIAQGGKRKFLDFLGDGMRDENWTRATNKWYGYQNLALLQNQWLDWVRQGSPSIESPKTRGSEALASTGQRPRPNSSIYRSEQASAELASTRPASAGVDDVTASESLILSARLAPVPRAASASAVGRGSKTEQDHASSAPAADRLKWQSPKTARGHSAAGAISGSSDTSDSQQHQVTRPQAMQQSRQIILEWSKPAEGVLADAQKSVYR